MRVVKDYNSITVKEMQDILDTSISDKKELYDMYKEHHNDVMSIQKAIKYPKRVFITGKKFRHYSDMLNTILVDGEEYTIDEVNNKILEFKKRKVVGN